ncbi:hypothetical protein Plhal304r1_c043g0123061 [Plasmopara halstedii]
MFPAAPQRRAAFHRCLRFFQQCQISGANGRSARKMVLIIRLLTETPKRGAFNYREGLVVVDNPLDEGTRSTAPESKRFPFWAGTLTVLPPLILRRQHARSRDGPWERSSSSQTII